MTPLAARLRKARARAGLSQAEAAARVGVSPAAVSLHEAGKTSPLSHVLLAYSDAYHVSADELLRGCAAGAPVAFEHAGADLVGVYRQGARRAQLGLLRRVCRRRPTLWRPCPRLAEVLGIDLGGTRTEDLHRTQAAWLARLNGHARAESEGGGRESDRPRRAPR